MARTALFLLLWISTWLGDAKSTYPQRYSLYSGQTLSPQHNSAAHGARAASRHRYPHSKTHQVQPQSYTIVLWDLFVSVFMF